MNNDKYLKSLCNKYTNGECNSLSCLKRGGYKKGLIVNNNIATCEAHEILEELKELRNN